VGFGFLEGGIGEWFGDDLKLIFVNHIAGSFCLQHLDSDTVIFQDGDHLAYLGDMR
jgi:hypothetical protein